MEKAVLISINPHPTAQIISGEKKVEIRKTKPNLPTPFPCYIYESCGNRFVANQNLSGGVRVAGRKKVIGEFVCDRIDYWQHHWSPDVMHIEKMSELSCVSTTELLDYLGGIYDKQGSNKKLYAWHISDLVIYDEPKEISEFVSASISNTDCFGQQLKWLDKAPQSWCYVNYLNHNAKEKQI